jgi:hypothetical protein
MCVEIIWKNPGAAIESNATINIHNQGSMTVPTGIRSFEMHESKVKTECDRFESFHMMSTTGNDFGCFDGSELQLQMKTHESNESSRTETREEKFDAHREIDSTN